MPAFLFVWVLLPGSASAQLYVAQDGNGTVSEYKPTTGEAINVNLITGLAGPGGLALSANTLFVANAGISMVGKYTVNATMVTEAKPTFISTGLSTPISVAVSGGHLFVVSANGNQAISEYDANTGMLEKASVLPPSTTQVGGPGTKAWKRWWVTPASTHLSAACGFLAKKSRYIRDFNWQSL
jgi:hypothetical protein